jgi:hypothetical protein
VIIKRASIISIIEHNAKNLCLVGFGFASFVFDKIIAPKTPPNNNQKIKGTTLKDCLKIKSFTISIVPAIAKE